MSAQKGGFPIPSKCLSTASDYAVLFSLISQVETKKEVFCRPGKHEHYVKQYGQCKKCDKCPPGWGYGKYQQVDMDPEHGAVSCRGCVKCGPGVSFSKFIGYGPCRPCENCSARGLGEKRPCITDRNARCGAPLPQPPTKQPLQNIEKPVDPKMTQHKNYLSTASEDLTSFKNVFVYTVVSVLFLMILIFTALYVRKRRSYSTPNLNRGSHQQTQRRTNRIIDATLETPLTQNDEHMSAGNRQLRLNTGSDVIREHETNPDRCQKESNHESIPLKESHFKIDEHLMDIDGAPLQTDKPTQRCTIPRGLGSNERTETLTDAELQRLCPALAAKNTYRRVGRMLGVRDRDIDIIREETRGDPKESAFQTLKKWTELKGNDATRQQLCLALGRIERQDLVDVITTSNNPTNRN